MTTRPAPGAPAAERVPWRMLVIVNPLARRFRTALLQTMRRLAPPDIELDIRMTAAAGTTTDLAREAMEGAAAVVAVGGDGTVSEVASALFDVDLPLGIVPAGSTNIIAQELGIPRQLRHACALLFGDHHDAVVDVGRWRDRSFLHMAGAGLDSRIFEAANVALKRRVGWLAYVPPAARNILQPPSLFRIVADELETEVLSSLVVIANGSAIVSPRLGLYPGIRSDDGWLDVLIFTPRGSLPIMRTLGEFATQRLEQSPHVVRLKARHVEVSADPPLPLQLDGDVVGVTPATLTIAPAALRVIVPPRSRGGEQGSQPDTRAAP